ncbi:MAG: GDSL family lipase [Desulfobulbaceae bacterium]|uniref:GDSL family lipase n=1 Tax=Candidatus Desulfobia pelagia TaxID=2841692 RepID=A0A8J6TCE1_9BACT|nr:GDSL family lipase [Candidatus Desulfobia pelagia]
MKKVFFIGDSLIEFFDWQRRFPEYDIDNEGIAGETVRGLLLAFPHITSRLDVPDAVVLMIGTNNLAMDDYAFLGDYQEILDSFQSLYPGCRVAVTSLLPLYLPWLAPDAVERLNDILRQKAEKSGGDFLDIFSRFRDAGKGERGLFLEDGVHLSDAGYAVWAKALEEYFAEIFA